MLTKRNFGELINWYILVELFLSPDTRQFENGKKHVECLRKVFNLLELLRKPDILETFRSICLL